MFQNYTLTLVTSKFMGVATFLLISLSTSEALCQSRHQPDESNFIERIKQIQGGKSVTSVLRLNSNSAPGLEQQYYRHGNSWVHYTNNTFTYDSQLREIDKIGTDAANQNVGRYTKAYDQQGNLSQDYYLHWINGSWQQTSASINIYTTYNSQSQPLERRFEVYNTSSLAFENNTISYYAYDNQDRLTELESKNYLGGNPEPHYKELHSYNTAGQLSEVIEQMAQNDIYENSRKRSNIIYVGSTPQVSSMDVYNWQNGAWELAYHYSWTYGPLGSISWLNERYDNGLWVNETRAFWEYDQHNNQITFVSEYWNGSWELGWESRDEYIYSSTFEILERINRQRNFLSEPLRLAHRDVYSNFITLGVQSQASQLPVSVFPNPATHAIRFSSPSDDPAYLQITDLAGRTVKRQKIQTLISGEISIEELIPGSYLLHISSREGSKTVRFVKL